MTKSWTNDVVRQWTIQTDNVELMLCNLYALLMLFSVWLGECLVCATMDSRNVKPNVSLVVFNAMRLRETSVTTVRPGMLKSELEESIYILFSVVCRQVEVLC